MKILHTADLHLQEYRDNRWQGLQAIVELGRQEKIDLLAISGDLFDSEANAQGLRGKIRELFSELGCPVLIIPGNHDAAAFPDGAFWGENVQVLRDLLNPLEIEGVFFWGFPYEDLMEEEILEYLYLAAGRATVGASHLLLFHGDLLDITGSWSQYGQEGRQRYLPVKLSYFRDLPWQYVLAGHFHSKFDVHEFKENGYFVYPGSPASITRRELGPRQVNLFHLGRPPAPVELETFYYQKLELHLSPFQEVPPQQILADALQELSPSARLLVEVFGFFNGRRLGKSETELQEVLTQQLADRGEIIKLEYRDIRDILEDDIFKLFLRRLNARDYEPEDKRAVLEITLKAMMEARA